jgi:AAA15 family ATPase/GTPase
MLLNFSTENNLSFSTLETFSMEATADKTREEKAVIENAGERILNLAAVFGANASGKSNLAASMHWLRTEVLSPVSQSLENPEIPVTPFLLRKGSDKKPSFFEVEFLWKGARYRYGLEATTQEFKSEFLFRKKPRGKEICLFKREKQDFELNANQFKEVPEAC